MDYEKKLIIWCENINAMYSARWITRKYVKKNFEVFIYTLDENVGIARDYFEKDVIINSINSIDRRSLKFLHSLLALILVPNSFSSMFDRIRKNRGLIAYSIGALKRPKFLSSNFNDIYHSIFSIFPNRLPTRFIISFTRPTKPYLLANNNIRHISIIESWDHPTKAPYFLKPTRCLAWNKPLGEDIRNFQKIHKISFIKPLKLNYITEYNKQSHIKLYKKLNSKYQAELQKLDQSKYVLYPTSTSSSNPVMHKGELLLIKHLLENCKADGFKLYIKPKPNGPVGDYDIFKKHISAIIGMYSSKPDNRDMLNDNYHIFRFLLLKRSHLVINAYTTFVLEAALADVPILQLKLLCSKFGKFSDLAKNYHIQNYLYPRKLIHNFEQENLNINNSVGDMRYTNYLKKWINNR
jgi:hypothetical protein